MRPFIQSIWGGILGYHLVYVHSHVLEVSCGVVKLSAFISLDYTHEIYNMSLKEAYQLH